MAWHATKHFLKTLLIYTLYISAAVCALGLLGFGAGLFLAGCKVALNITNNK